MGAAFFVLAVATLGVNFGWQPARDSDTGYDVIVQVEPGAASKLPDGRSIPIEGNVPDHIKPVRSIRVVVGTEPPRRMVRITPMKPSLLESDGDSLQAAVDNGNQTAEWWRDKANTQPARTGTPASYDQGRHSVSKPQSTGVQTTGVQLTALQGEPAAWYGTNQPAVRSTPTNYSPTAASVQSQSNVPWWDDSVWPSTSAPTYVGSTATPPASTAWPNLNASNNVPPTTPVITGNNQSNQPWPKDPQLAKTNSLPPQNTTGPVFPATPQYPNQQNPQPYNSTPQYNSNNPPRQVPQQPIDDRYLASNGNTGSGVMVPVVPVAPARSDARSATTSTANSGWGNNQSWNLGNQQNNAQQPAAPLPNVPAPVLVTSNSPRQQYYPQQPIQASSAPNLGYSNAGIERKTDSNMGAFAVALLVLVGSLAFNLYVGYSYMDSRHRYRALLRKTTMPFIRSTGSMA